MVTNPEEPPTSSATSALCSCSPTVQMLLVCCLVPSLVANPKLPSSTLLFASCPSPSFLVSSPTLTVSNLVGFGSPTSPSSVMLTRLSFVLNSWIWVPSAPLQLILSAAIPTVSASFASCFNQDTFDEYGYSVLMIIVIQVVFRILGMAGMYWQSAGQQAQLVFKENHNRISKLEDRQQKHE